MHVKHFCNVNYYQKLRYFMSPSGYDLIFIRNLNCHISITGTRTPDLSVLKGILLIEMRCKAWFFIFLESQFCIELMFTYHNFFYSSYAIQCLLAHAFYLICFEKKNSRSSIYLYWCMTYDSVYAIQRAHYSV